MDFILLRSAMTNAELSQQMTVFSSPVAGGSAPSMTGAYAPAQKRHRRAVRSQKSIQMAILEACRTPTVQHWIMVKARLGYDTFWKHMNTLASNEMISTSNDGYKTLYSVNQKGLALLEELEMDQA